VKSKGSMSVLSRGGTPRAVDYVRRPSLSAFESDGKPLHKLSEVAQ